MSSREALFGTDLRVGAAAGGLDLRGGGDLGLARGDDCVVQGLRLRLVVREGELAPLGWPGFGSRLHELIGERDTPRTRARLAAYARAAVEGDRRVQKVVAVTVTSVPGERIDLAVRLDLDLVGRDVPVTFAHVVALEGT